MNSVDPFRLLEASELRIMKLKESLDFYCQEFEALKRNDIYQKRKISDLQAANDAYALELTNANKTISSYQHIQLRHLHEIENMKRLRPASAAKDVQPKRAATSDSTTQTTLSLSEFLTATTSIATAAPVKAPKSDEINTIEMSRVLNELLKTHKFSSTDLKSIFDISHQTIDEILNRPKPWSALSQRIKIVYMQISSHLKNTPEFVEKIRTLNMTSSSSSSSDNDDNDSDFEESEEELKTKKQKTEADQPNIEYNTEHLKSTPFFNTNDILDAVKKKLKDAGLTQRVFSDALFNTIGQMVFTYRSWDKSGPKFKARTLVMHMWLQDPLGIQKLKDYDEGKYDPKNYPLSQPQPQPQPQQHIKVEPLSSSENDIILLADD